MSSDQQTQREQIAVDLPYKEAVYGRFYSRSIALHRDGESTMTVTPQGLSNVGNFKTNTNIGGDDLTSDEALRVYLFISVTSNGERWITLSRFLPGPERLTGRDNQFPVQRHFFILKPQDFQQIHNCFAYLVDCLPQQNQRTRFTQAMVAPDPPPLQVNLEKNEQRLRTLWQRFGPDADKLVCLIEATFTPPVSLLHFAPVEEERLALCELLHCLLPIPLRPELSFTTFVLGSLGRNPTLHLYFIERQKDFIGASCELNWLTGEIARPDRSPEALLPDGHRYPALFAQDIVACLRQGEGSKEWSHLTAFTEKARTGFSVSWSQTAIELYDEWLSYCPASLLQARRQDSQNDLTLLEWVHWIEQSETFPSSNWQVVLTKLSEAINQTIDSQPETPPGIQVKIWSAFLKLLTSLGPSERDQIVAVTPALWNGRKTPRVVWELMGKLHENQESLPLYFLVIEGLQSTEGLKAIYAGYGDSEEFGPVLESFLAVAHSEHESILLKDIQPLSWQSGGKFTWDLLNWLRGCDREEAKRWLGILAVEELRQNGGLLSIYKGYGKNNHIEDVVVGLVASESWKDDETLLLRTDRDGNDESLFIFAWRLFEWVNEERQGSLNGRLFKLALRCLTVFGEEHKRSDGETAQYIGPHGNFLPYLNRGWQKTNLLEEAEQQNSRTEIMQLPLRSARGPESGAAALVMLLTQKPMSEVWGEYTHALYKSATQDLRKGLSNTFRLLEALSRIGEDESKDKAPVDLGEIANELRPAGEMHLQALLALLKKTEKRGAAIVTSIANLNWLAKSLETDPVSEAERDIFQWLASRMVEGKEWLEMHNRRIS